MNDQFLDKTISERYRIDTKLFGDLRGAVYRAYDERLQRKVVLKLLSLQTWQAIHNTVQDAARFDHANLIDIFDFGNAGNRFFVVMRYVEGRNLRRLIDEKDIRPDQQGRILKILQQVADGLRTLHEKGHGPVTPTAQDIILEADDHLYIADYNLRWLMHGLPDEADQPKDATLWNDVSYTAPEVLGQRKIDLGLSDQFSLGVLAAELLTGVHPFRANSPSETIQRILNDAPTFPTTQAAARIKVFERALSKDPTKRYPSMGDFIVALGTTLDLSTPPESAFAPPPAPTTPPPEAVEDIVLGDAANGAAEPTSEAPEAQPQAEAPEKSRETPHVPKKPDFFEHALERKEKEEEPHEEADPKAPPPPKKTDKKRITGSFKLEGIEGARDLDIEVSEEVAEKLATMSPEEVARYLEGVDRAQSSREVADFLDDDRRLIDALDADEQEEAAESDGVATRHRGATPASPSPGNRPTPPLQSTPPESETTPVLFKAYYPRHVRVGDLMPFYVYALHEAAEDAVRQDVQQFAEKLGGVPIPVAAAKKPRLRVGTLVTIVLISDGHEQPVYLTRRWNGRWVRFELELPIAIKLAGQSFNVDVSVQVRGIEIARIAHCNIAVGVGEESTPTENPLALAKMADKQSAPYQHIFVSYSRRDKTVIEAYRAAQIAIGNEVFVDTYSIRSGEDWRAALARAIDEADIFQLFWSRNAAASENVRHEWEYALEVRCPDDRCRQFIRPVYWEMPMPTVPGELGHLNFRYAHLAAQRPLLPWLMLGGISLLLFFVVVVAVLA